MRYKYTSIVASLTYELFSVGTKYGSSGFKFLATVRLFLGAFLDCLFFDPVRGGVPWIFDGGSGARVREGPAAVSVVCMGAAEAVFSSMSPLEGASLL